MKTMIKIAGVSKQEVLEHLFMAVEYKQKGDDTFAFYYSKAYAKEDLDSDWGRKQNVTFYKGWENEGFVTLYL